MWPFSRREDDIEDDIPVKIRAKSAAGFPGNRCFDAAGIPHDCSFNGLYEELKPFSDSVPLSSCMLTADEERAVSEAGVPRRDGDIGYGVRAVTVTFKGRDYELDVGEPDGYLDPGCSTFDTGLMRDRVRYRGSPSC